VGTPADGDGAVALRSCLAPIARLGMAVAATDCSCAELTVDKPASAERLVGVGDERMSLTFIAEQVEDVVEQVDHGAPLKDSAISGPDTRSNGSDASWQLDVMQQ